VHGFEDLQTSVWVFALDGRLVHEITPDEPGTLAPASSRPTGGWDDVEPIVADADQAGFSFWYTSYTTSPRRLHVDLRSGELQDRSDEPPIRLDDLVVTRRSCRASDGTTLVISLVTRKEHDLSRPSPTFLTAYGAFRNTTLPSYLGALAAFVRSGGVFAEVIIRGGGEFGHDWWQAGRFARKQDSFNDVYAAAEYLFSSSVAERGRLAFYGCSHGGMLAGTVLTQRPDLFSAVVVGAPVLDLLRFHLDPYLAWACVKEYGNPLDAEESEWLSSYSPYHRVRDGVEYPPCLIICAEQDLRTRPLHGRKMVARLQAASAGTALLRVYKGRHQQVCDRASNPGQIAEWVGFIMKHLGMEAPSVPEPA
jgi:prolyl oligopeptidase